MSRARLRLTLGLAIFENVSGRLVAPNVKRKLTREVLCKYGIRKNTTITPYDWSRAIDHATGLRNRPLGGFERVEKSRGVFERVKLPNILEVLRLNQDHPTYKRVNEVFGIG